MVKRYKFIGANFEIVQRLVRGGDMSGKVIADYKIYLAFTECEEPLKMDKYQSTAELCKCSPRTVMNAIKNMESFM